MCSIWMKDMKKWFGKWDVTHLLHDASLHFSINEAFLQHQRIITWDKCGGSCFTHYTTHVALSYKTIFFVKLENRTLDTCQSLSHCLPFRPLLPCNLAHMHCDVSGCVGARVKRVVDYAHFRHIFDQTQSLHKFLTTTMCILDCNIYWYSS